MKNTKHFLLTVSIFLGPLAIFSHLAASSCCGVHAAPTAAQHPAAPPDHTAKAVVPVAALDAYLAIQQALAADSMEGVTANARAIAEAIQPVDQAAAQAAMEIATATDIAAVRRHFATLSTRLIDLGTEHGLAAGTARVAFCPMAFANQGAAWLQTGDTLANPYYGARMLRCGTFRATLSRQ
jgi:Cu(I)/Ag(I) efflux system membrane fusion protein